jgi:hypothetical protein
MQDIALKYLRKALSGFVAGFVIHVVFMGPL